MSEVNQVHEEKETLVIDCNLPGHEDRITTELFTRTRKEYLEKFGDKCQVSDEPSSECGPIELHHFWVERCTANAVDPERLHKWIRIVLERAQSADAWFESQLSQGKSYDEIWSDPYAFTDSMAVNGIGLSKRLHTGKGEGLHYFPGPLWNLWATGKRGFVFVGKDAIQDEAPTTVTTPGTTIDIRH